MSNTNIKRYGAPAATALLMALVLAACGGGGGNPGAVGGTGSGSTGTGGTGTGGTTVTATPTVTVESTLERHTHHLAHRRDPADGQGDRARQRQEAGAERHRQLHYRQQLGGILAHGRHRADRCERRRQRQHARGQPGRRRRRQGHRHQHRGRHHRHRRNELLGWRYHLGLRRLGASPNSIQAYGSTVLSVDVLAGSSKYTEQQVNVTFTSACVAKPARRPWPPASLPTTAPRRRSTATRAAPITT
jgi:hypothetical protein